MVDPVGFRIAALARPVAPAAPVSAVETAAPAAPARRVETSSLRALAEPAARTAPIDVERVAKIKKAIADGNFPLVPSTIADRLLALKLEWNPNEPA